MCFTVEPTGKVLFTQNCVICHKNGLNAIPTYTEKTLFKSALSEYVPGYSENSLNALEAVIANGVGYSMPGFKSRGFTDSAIHDIAEYVQSQADSDWSVK